MWWPVLRDMNPMASEDALQELVLPSAQCLSSRRATNVSTLVGHSTTETPPPDFAELALPTATSSRMERGVFSASQATSPSVVNACSPRVAVKVSSSWETSV